jgi:hypothetical protein
MVNLFNRVPRTQENISLETKPVFSQQNQVLKKKFSAILWDLAKQPDKVNVRRINGVFLTFLLQTFLSQSGSYYLIGTEVKLDIVLPVNIFRY